jgi:aspartate/methionine/tyrosine aminotransferase
MTETRSAALAAAVDRLGTETAFGVLARAQELERSGRSIVHLEIGEPDFETPPHVVAAAVDALGRGLTHYCPAAGLPELREAAAGYLRRTRGLDVQAGDCLVGTGAKPFVFFTVLATCGPGDEVIVPDPGFPIYASAVRYAGATPVPVPLVDADGFTLDPERLRALLSPRTRLVIVNAPHNPTGGSLDEAAADAVASVLEETDAWILLDEIYAQLQYDVPFGSIAARGRLRDRAVVLDGLSKAYAMTGWRCGFAAVPPPLLEPLVRFFVNSTSCVPPFVQHGAVAALDGPQDSVEAMRAELLARRGIAVEGLNGIPGVRCAVPAGAFYAFPDVSGLPVEAERIAADLLETAGVAVLAGTAFGAQGAGHLRLSYGGSRDQLAEGLRRISDYVATSSPGW